MPRIVGGTWRSRQLQAPKGRETRPTADKVRGAVFNVLAHLDAVADAVVWDLFAGSGALGLEALSRGAAHAAFVESHRRTAQVLQANIAALGAGAQARVAVQPAERWLAHPAAPGPATLVLADPPYASGVHAGLLQALAACPAVAPNAIIVLEAAADAAWDVPPSLELLQTKAYGDTQVVFYRKGAETGDGLHPPQ